MVRVLLLVMSCLAFTSAASGQERMIALEDFESQLEAAVAEMAGMERVFAVSVMPLRGGMIDIEITYRTLERGEVGYLSEALEVYRVVGTLTEREGYSAHLVSLVPVILVGRERQPLEYIVAGGEQVQAFSVGDVTRTDFLDTLQRLPGSHQQVEPRENI